MVNDACTLPTLRIVGVLAKNDRMARESIGKERQVSLHGRKSVVEQLDHLFLTLRELLGVSRFIEPAKVSHQRMRQCCYGGDASSKA